MLQAKSPVQQGRFLPVVRRISLVVDLSGYQHQIAVVTATHLHWCHDTTKLGPALQLVRVLDSVDMNFLLRFHATGWLPREVRVSFAAEPPNSPNGALTSRTWSVIQTLRPSLICTCTVRSP